MNTKLSRTIMSATLLVGALALAGCGGGDDTPAEESGMSAEDKIAAAEAAAAEAEADKKAAEDALAAEKQKQADAQAAADAMKAQGDAKALRAALMMAMVDRNDDAYYAEEVGTSGPAGLKSKDGYESMSVSIMGDPFNKEYTLVNGMIGVTGASVVMPKYVDGAAFSTSGTKAHTANHVNSSGKPRFQTSGTYHGVAGTYSCDPDGSPCTSNVDSTDALMLTGAWTFMPSNPAATVSDGKAVQYGWWIDNLGKTGEDLHVFYGAADLSKNGDFAQGGKATYEGGAAGKYAIHRGAGAENDSGHFTANAMLEADFGGESANISGMIDDFMGADGKSRDWSVKLQSAAITNSASWTADASDGTVWTMDGAKAEAGGDWSGAMYGGSSTGTPTAVAGAFSAEHGNIGSMIGSFGAEKK